MNELQIHIYEFGDFRIDVAKRLLLMRDGERIPLTPKAFDTLLYLVQHSGTLLEKEELLRAVWADTIVEENNLNQHISTLRRLLGERRDGHRYIVTVPGRGYRFVADVSGRTNVGEQKKVEEEQPVLDEKPAKQSKASAPSQLDQRSGKQDRNVWIGLFAGVVTIGLVVATFYFWRARTKTVSVSSIRTIAVLPFKPLVAENRDEALEMGVADSLIARFSHSREIIVRPTPQYRLPQQEAILGSPSRFFTADCELQNTGLGSSPKPIFAESPEARNRFPVFLPICCSVMVIRQTSITILQSKHLHLPEVVDMDDAFKNAIRGSNQERRNLPFLHHLKRSCRQSLARDS
jgi:DNA-binding winged helix-turn-helix (wHTH) protein